MIDRQGYYRERAGQRRDGMTLELRVEAYNLLYRVNFNLPGSTPGAPIRSDFKRPGAPTGAARRRRQLLR
jgi:hypothetical protein